jgi:hypothetical protein
MKIIFPSHSSDQGLRSPVKLYFPSASAGNHGFYPWGKAQRGFGEMEPVASWRMSRRSRFLAKAGYNGTTGYARGVPYLINTYNRIKENG